MILITLELMLMVVTMIVLIAASYCDLRTKEVPDLLTWGLVFVALGLRFLFSWERGWMILVSGILGLGLGYGIAAALYYTSQWGGGDSKLLMGMGAVLGFSWPLTLQSFSVLAFFVILLFVGAMYGLFWMIFLAMRKGKVFWQEYYKILQRWKRLHHVVLMVSLLLFVAVALTSWQFWFFLPIPLGLFYIFTFVSTVEDHFFFKRVSPLKLTEGDWLAEDVVVKGKVEVKKKTLEMEDLTRIQELYHQKKMNLVLIREGIPFVPSFLLTYLLFVFVPAQSAFNILF